MNKGLTYLIMCGTVTFEFSSNTLVIRPLQRMLSMHYDIEQKFKWREASNQGAKNREQRKLIQSLNTGHTVISFFETGGFKDREMSLVGSSVSQVQSTCTKWSPSGTSLNLMALGVKFQWVGVQWGGFQWGGRWVSVRWVVPVLL